MAHFAQLNSSNTVINVIVVNNEVIGDTPFPDSEPIGIAFCQQLYGSATKWKQTSYNANFRGNYASPGYIYDLTLDKFIPPKPYPSWLFDTESGQWSAPIPYPSDGNTYYWDEITQSWIYFTIP